ncbi:sulfite exporter TauE/SafE family protein 3-like [Vigna unguiculata]|uniref:sulfite exporter TauE/SafE family protein 3-like n=1 Tax=Vigna unguiculata TaxID=3917 RepID=UPI001016A478|nr:sulfite exporter TauE/SafE family protein 3-like [Vigna unguiculata]XP_027929899.1 sulfite exporter TauE/SafE family protein 3-like [Vigna unguiculata]XP_027929902.1 sulfite exporter TauE/SafE family protein 3-like [Vigna unguiculata]XP_027929903.1 sulfite exporter TauE/SafE family protein 3-like [Vigna unguiculata]
MALNGSKHGWDVRVVGVIFLLFVSPSLSVSVHENPNEKTMDPTMVETREGSGFLSKVANFLWSSSGSGYQHTWPDIEFGWRIVTGTIIGFLGSAFGTVGGVGGGGIFVTMLSLIIGFDPKSATAISKCMITGGAASTVFYNLKQKHPTLDMPVIDYDLALLFQPVLVLGISIGVVFNVIFADWMITILLIIIFAGIATKALLKGIETWKKETIIKKESARQSQLNGAERTEEVAYEPLPGGPTAPNGSNHAVPEKSNQKRSLVGNIRWKALGILFTVWVVILACEIGKSHTTTCSIEYWILNILQVPVALGVTTFQAVRLYKGKTVIASKGDQQTQWRPHQLIMYSACGICAGMVGGLLGLGGGFILGPLFLELGIPPQVSSATATFAMTFSASMSVVEYYLLNRFPIPYTLYFVAVSTLAAFVGQVLVKKLVALLGRASLIIFILSGTIFVSALSLGSVGIANMIQKIEHQQYMGFENLCTYAA